jgi:hypothetical protein
LQGKIEAQPLSDQIRQQRETARSRLPAKGSYRGEPIQRHRPLNRKRARAPHLEILAQLAL